MSTDILSIAILAVQGLAGLVTALVLRSINTLSTKVDEIKDQLGSHGADLARGEQRMSDMAVRLAELRADMQRVEREGCARACVARSTP